MSSGNNEPQSLVRGFENKKLLTILCILLVAAIIAAIWVLVLDNLRRNNSVTSLWSAYTGLATNTTIPITATDLNQIDQRNTWGTDELSGLTQQVISLIPGHLSVVGLQGQEGKPGKDGQDGVNGRNGTDGVDGVAVCAFGQCASLQTTDPTTLEVGSINVDGTVSASFFEGDGSNLDNLNASRINVGTLDSSLFPSNLTLPGSLTIGLDGTSISQVRVFTPTLNPSSVAAASTAEEIYAVSGLVTTDIIYVNKPTYTAGCGIVNARVSATNTLALTWMNAQTLLSCDPPSEVYNIVAIRS